MPRTIRIPRHRPPVRAGTLLAEEFMEPLGLSVTALARHIGVGRDRLSEVINGRRRVTPDTAMRLSLAFGTSVQFWLNAQLAEDLDQARHSVNVADRKKIKPIVKVV